MPPRLENFPQLLLLERIPALEHHVRDPDLRRLDDLVRHRRPARTLVWRHLRRHLRARIARLFVKLLDLQRVRKDLTLIQRLADGVLLVLLFRLVDAVDLGKRRIQRGRFSATGRGLKNK